MSFQVPDWAGRLLQGLSYWVAYKNTLYPDYPLREAALIAEATTLLYTNKDKYSINCEVMYKDLSGLQNLSGNEAKTFIQNLGGKRVDLIINNKNNNIEECLIEVKRILDDSTIEEEEIEKDIDRLAGYLQYTSCKDTRCFVLVVSQGDIPRKYVNESFQARKANHIDDYYYTKEKQNKYRVRMVRKAIPSLKEAEKYNSDKIGGRKLETDDYDDSDYFTVKTVFSMLLEVYRETLTTSKNEITK